LPHQEPFAADAEEGDEPHQKCESQCGDGGAFGLLKGSGGAAERAGEAGGAPPAEEHGEGFPGDDGDVESGVQGGRVLGTPHTVIAGEGGVHHEDVADELVVGVVVGEVIEDDKGIEESDGGDEGELGDAQRHGFSLAVESEKARAAI